MSAPPRVSYERLDAWPIVDNDAVELVRPHTAYRDVISRAGHGAEGTLDTLVAAVRDVLDTLSQNGNAESALVRDALTALEAHETACDRLIWWSKAIADQQ